MKNKFCNVLIFFKNYWLLIFSVVGVFFGVGDIVEAYYLRIADNLSIAVYYLLSGLGLLLLSFDMIIVHFMDAIYCHFFAKERDKNKNKNENKEN